ncbi:TolC family protein [Sunxiuqinia sp. sy24]|uniref:TolC family protein n=1 Tax=Sunxiuqinia sp. sy24 TaxID=3461495 RepID=UPI0040457901
MRTKSIKNILFVIGISGLLLSCSSSRHFQKEEVDTQGLFGVEATDSVSLAEKPWQELFSDPYLKALIQDGLDNNLDLQLAVQKIVAAEAYLGQSKAALLPGVTAQGSVVHSRNSESTNPAGPRELDVYQLNAQASWELDIWGKLRSSKRAAYANLLASDAGHKAVQTRLIANIATAYYSLVALDAKLEITRETVANNIDLVETMKVLKDNGRVTGAAIVQSEAARYAAEVTLPDLEHQIRETENRLSLLLGRTPGTIERGSLADQEAVALLQTGVPAQLLENRPDVMQAQYGVMSAYEMTNSAKAYFFPSVTLTANAGFEALDLADLLDPSSFAANVVGGLASPIFNRKANTTRLKVARAQQAEALLGLRLALLNAGQEVNNALGAYDASANKIILRQKQLTALKKSVEYTNELLTYGSATYTEVLNAQQSLLAAQLSNVNDHVQQLNAIVSLYRSLGGGWK